MDSTATQTESADGTSKFAGIVGAAKDKAGQIAGKSKQVTGQTVDKARTQVKSSLTKSKDRTASTLMHVGDAFRTSGQQFQDQGHSHLSQYAGAAADRLGNVSTYLSDRSVDDVFHDAEDLARREPALFIGGALALGILAGRFLKSSTPAPANDWREEMADTR